MQNNGRKPKQWGLRLEQHIHHEVAKQVYNSFVKHAVKQDRNGYRGLKGILNTLGYYKAVLPYGGGYRDDYTGSSRKYLKLHANRFPWGPEAVRLMQLVWCGTHSKPTEEQVELATFGAEPISFLLRFARLVDSNDSVIRWGLDLTRDLDKVIRAKYSHIELQVMNGSTVIHNERHSLVDLLKGRDGNIGGGIYFTTLTSIACSGDDDVRVQLQLFSMARGVNHPLPWRDYAKIDGEWKRLAFQGPEWDGDTNDNDSELVIRTMDSFFKFQTIQEARITFILCDIRDRWTINNSYWRNLPDNVDWWKLRKFLLGEEGGYTAFQMAGFIEKFKSYKRWGRIVKVFPYVCEKFDLDTHCETGLVPPSETASETVAVPSDAQQPLEPISEAMQFKLAHLRKDTKEWANEVVGSQWQVQHTDKWTRVNNFLYGDFSKESGYCRADIVRQNDAHSQGKNPRWMRVMEVLDAVETRYKSKLQCCNDIPSDKEDEYTSWLNSIDLSSVPPSIKDYLKAEAWELKEAEKVYYVFNKLLPK